MFMSKIIFSGDEFLRNGVLKIPV